MHFLNLKWKVQKVANHYYSISLKSHRENVNILDINLTAIFYFKL